MTGYVRIDTINNIADGNVISAADLDGEFNGVQAAFNSSTGHTHDGTASEGAPITKLGPSQNVTVSTTVLGVAITNTVDLGTSSLKFKDFYLAGNALIGGTLGVTSTATFTGAVIFNGNTTIGDADTDTITQAASYVTGTQLKSAKTATNTLSLAAYDVDGTAYTNLITLTASNTPTLALTSTGVGTINNMSIGATTASTGAFTTLTSNGATTFTAGTASTTTGTGTLVITGGLGVSGRINAANFDGIVGANTAAAGAFTTLSATGDLSFSTVGSKVNFATTSSATVNYVGGSADGFSLEMVTQRGASQPLKYKQDYGVGHVWSVAGSDKMTLDNNGNLGIGTSSPISRLDVRAASDVIGNYQTIQALSTDSAAIDLGGGIGLGGFYSGTSSIAVFGNIVGRKENGTGGNYAGYLAFGTNAQATGIVERARFTSAGYFKASNSGAYANVGATFHEIVNTADNAEILFLRSAATSNPYGLTISWVSASPNDTTRYFLRCDDSTAQRFTARSNGGLANYSANDVNLSDRREKTNFAPAKSYLDVICAIPVQTFNYIDQNMEDDGGLTLGVVAQDVQAVAPELVMESNWAGKDEEPKMRLSIYQTDLQYALMKCIQEQQALITQLTARITALEGA